MTWFTENPWPLILIMLGVAAVMLILGGTRGRSLALLFAVLAVGEYFMESAIVTPSEEIENSLAGLLEGFIAKDLNAINSHIDDDAYGLKQTAQQGLDLVTLDESFHLQSIVVTISEDGRTAVADLRANGSLTVHQANAAYHAATRWSTNWKQHEDGWKLAEVHRLNPLNGDEMGVLSAQ